MDRNFNLAAKKAEAEAAAKDEKDGKTVRVLPFASQYVVEFYAELD